VSGQRKGRMLSMITNHQNSKFDLSILLGKQNDTTAHQTYF
jgi:hypothetical protein